MIPRYSAPEMDAVWSDPARFDRWLEVELLATEAHAGLGIVPAAAAAACRSRAPVTDEGFVAAVSERERVTDHDVAAFVDVVQEAIGPPAGSWIHYGLGGRIQHAKIESSAWDGDLRKVVLTFSVQVTSVPAGVDATYPDEMNQVYK